MTPVEVAQTPWHFTTWLDLFDHWQTVIAGVLALLAAFGTIVVTMIIANKQIVASREEAGRVITATREQTSATFKQTDATVTLDQLHEASEALAFHAMLEAAMARVLAEAAWAKETYPKGAVPAGLARQCITNGAFAELRAACVRRGGDLTGDFLDLEREIDSFASSQNPPATVGEQLTRIKEKATALREKAAERFSGSVPPAPPKRSGGAVTGLP